MFWFVEVTGRHWQISCFKPLNITQIYTWSCSLKYFWASMPPWSRGTCRRYSISSSLVWIKLQKHWILHRPRLVGAHIFRALQALMTPMKSQWGLFSQSSSRFTEDVTQLFPRAEYNSCVHILNKNTFCQSQFPALDILGNMLLRSVSGSYMRRLSLA